MIVMKVVRIIILSNIELHDQPFRMHRSPPRSHQNFPDSKIQRFDKSDRYFRFDHKSVLVEMKVVRNVILNNIDLYDKPLRMHRSPPKESPKFFRFEKFKDLTDISDLII